MEAVELLEAMRGEGSEGFAVCAVNDPEIRDWSSGRAAEGVPCVTFNSDLPENGRLCFVGQDICQAGRVAAGLLYKCVSGRGVILATAGNLKFDGHRQRLDGFREQLAVLGFPEDRVVIVTTLEKHQKGRQTEINRALRWKEALSITTTVSGGSAGRS